MGKKYADKNQQAEEEKNAKPPENKKINNKDKIKNVINKIPYQKWQFWSILVGAIFLICGIIYITIPKYDYEERDVNGMVVSDACKIVKEHGWKVIVKNSYKGNSDCYNTDKIVYWYVYQPQWGEAWLYYTLPNKVSEDELLGIPANEACKKVKALGWDVDEPLRQNVPGNYLEVGSCNSVKDEIEEVHYHEEELKVYFYVKASNKESATSSNNQTATSNNKTSQNSSNSEWKQLLKDYEAWVDKYIVFMKKYKNASATELAGMMSEYSSLMSDMTTWTEKMNNMKSDLSGSDLTEYVSTLSRISQKLSSI